MAKRRRSVEERFKLITRNAEEIIGEKELKDLLKRNEKLRHYIGFEISGKIHLGNGLVSMLKVRDFLKAGVDCRIFLADWHTWINDKLGGNPEVIKRVAVGYFKEGMKASMKCVGGNSKKIKFVLGTDLYHKNDLYWATVIDVCKFTTLSRVMRSITILGREEGGSVDFAKLIYAPMQVADIFIQKLNLVHAGIDQRKAHVIARDVAMKLSFSPLLKKGGKQTKPIAVHHPLILGLGKPPVWPIPKNKMKDFLRSLKMSKSKPNTAIFIHDSPEEIRKKITNAFCPKEEVVFNPVIDWVEKLIFPIRQKLEVKRKKEFGGDKLYKSLEVLKRDFSKGDLHPLDLKDAVIESLIEILKPARKHFSKGKPKKMLDDLKNLMKEYK